MDVISFSEAATANSRIEIINANPDSSSGIVTVPKTIASGETVTIPAGRVAVLPNVQIDGVLNIENGGEVFIPSGATFCGVVEKVTSTDNAIVRFDGTTGKVQNSGVVIDDSGNIGSGTQTFNGFGGSGFKNYIINGDMRVAQRGVAPTITTSPTYGKADRFLGYVSEGTSVSGYIEQSLDTNFNSGYRLWLSALSYTNGVWAIQQRIESFNSKYLNGKKVTVSFRIYHDFGSTRAITVTLSKPTSLDNFGSTSIVGSVYTSQPIPTATYTNVTASFTIGSSDATNGLMLQINALSAETATSKNVLIGDIQLEEGSIATPFEHLSYALQYEQCRRYYRRYATQQNVNDLAYKMRTTPTESGTAPYTYSAEL